MHTATPALIRLRHSRLAWATEQDPVSKGGGRDCYDLIPRCLLSLGVLGRPQGDLRSASAVESKESVSSLAASS